jgi:hypothetical protein
MPHGLDHWGRYCDRYQRVDGAWRIARRTEVRDGMVDGGWCHRLWGPDGGYARPDQSTRTGGCP